MIDHEASVNEPLGSLPVEDSTCYAYPNDIQDWEGSIIQSLDHCQSRQPREILSESCMPQTEYIRDFDIVHAYLNGVQPESEKQKLIKEFINPIPDVCNHSHEMMECSFHNTSAAIDLRGTQEHRNHYNNFNKHKEQSDASKEIMEVTDTSAESQLQDYNKLQSIKESAEELCLHYHHLNSISLLLDFPGRSTQYLDDQHKESIEAQSLIDTQNTALFSRMQNKLQVFNEVVTHLKTKIKSLERSHTDEHLRFIDHLRSLEQAHLVARMKLEARERLNSKLALFMNTPRM